MQAVFLRYFSRDASLLELNCGTGTDAIALARHGLTIHATDDSAAMVAIAQQKILRAGMQSRISVERLSFQELSRLKGRTFDGAYSNFGGLNCVHDLSPVARDLGRLVKPGSYVSLCVMTRFCLRETVSFLVRFRWHDAFRRLRRTGVEARVHGSTIRVFYHSVPSLVATFGPWFEPVEIGGLNIMTPPPVKSNGDAFSSRVLSLLESVDDIISRWYPFRTIGDHSYIVLRRNAAGGAA